MRCTHLAASMPCTQPESLQPQLRPNVDRERGTLKQESRSGFTPAHRQQARRLLTKHTRPGPLPVPTPEVTSSRNSPSAPFLTPVSPLFNLHTCSAVQKPPSKTVAPASSQNTQCHPVHELTLPSNSTESPKAATGQIQTQPIRVLPAAESGFRMCDV